MKKIILPDENVIVNGLAWYEHNKSRMLRLPYELEEEVGEDIWELAKHTSGVRLRFCSNTTSLYLKVRYTGKQYPNYNLSELSQKGIDLYIDGQLCSFMVPHGEEEAKGEFLINASRKFREFTLNLPLYQHVEVDELILDDDAVLIQPKPFALPMPVIFYGTSITQGGCASRPGLAYQSVISRDLNIDFINLGFSGYGKGEQCIAKAISEIDTPCYVLDYGANNKSVEGFEEVYLPFVSEIRKKKKDTPIILVTLILHSGELYNKATEETFFSKREVIRKAYNSLISSGDKNVYLVEGLDLFSSVGGEGLADTVHPNDIGFMEMGKGLEKVISKVLNI